MNKLFFLLTVLIIGFTGCTKKTDLIYEAPVDERIQTSLNNYQAALTSGPGWKLFVYPQGLNSENIRVGGFTYYLRFTNTNRVTMVSDFSTDIAVLPKESGYRLKAVERPSLIFDTYSYMHIPADPDPDVSFSPADPGLGWGSDFNFSFTSLEVRDTMVLEGNYNNSKAVLIRATQAEMDAAFSEGQLADIMNDTYDYVDVSPFLSFEAGGSQIAVGFDFNSIIMSFTSVANGGIVVNNVPFSFTTTGIYLQDPVTFGSYTFQEMFWDDVMEVYYFLSGGTRVNLVTTSNAVVAASLANLLGTQFTQINVPTFELPGQSPLFRTRYNTIKTQIKNGIYNLDLDDMIFVFNSAFGTMAVQVLLFQNGVGPFLAQYNYTYVVDGDGNFKFTRTGQNGNAGLISTNMNNILIFFQNDRFKVEAVATNQGILGRFTSVENPTFFFTGNLQ